MVSLSTTNGQVIPSGSATVQSAGVINYSLLTSPTSTPTPTPTPTPHPTTTPTPTPTPHPTTTPTPTPTPTPNGNNLAPINDGQWHSDSSWNICPADNIYYDTTTTHNGAPTWRIEPGASLAVDHDWGMLAIKPGDHIVMKCWVKTSGTPDSVVGRSGATVAFDVYGNYGGTWARIGCCNSPGFIPLQGNYGNGWPSDSATWLVNWGNNWVLKTFDFIVPSQWWGDGAMSSHQVPRGTYATPAWICPWLMVTANYGSNIGTYTTWVSDFQLYINP